MEDIGGAVISQRMWGREEREGKEWEWGWVEGEMERSLGFWEGGGLEEDEWGRLWRWVIRKRVTNMMETNELVRMVYHISYPRKSNQLRTELIQRPHKIFAKTGVRGPG